MFSKLKTKMFEAFGTWCINRAMRRPHEHLLDDDGKPHAHRYWLFRIGSGKPNGDGDVHPFFAIKVCQLVSSEEALFHDDAAHSTTVVLRGAISEVTPHGIQLWKDRIHMVSRYNGFEPTEYGKRNVTSYLAGSVLRRKAGCWHFFTLPAGTESCWLLSIIGPKRQTWGFLADGFAKVPARTFLERRRQQRNRPNGKKR